MKISIVTVCLNAEATIAATIASVATQTWADFEHLIIDGGSRDGTAAVVAAASHHRLRFISESDRGIYDAMNKGLALAAGDYVVFLNADDFFATPETLAFVAAAATRTDADCIIGDTRFVSESGYPAGRIYSTWGFRPWWLRIGVMPPHPSFFGRTALLREIGGFDLDYRISSDFDLVARIFIARRASWVRVPQVLTYFRAGGVSTQGITAKQKIGDETSRSLAALGQPFAKLAVMLRYGPKAVHLAVGWLQARVGAR
jgi:glycosyltransferase involved in cell wall biosynthesis